MSEFYVGQKVVYVIGQNHKRDKCEVGDRLVRNEIYTIRALGVYPHFAEGPCIAIWVVEKTRRWVSGTNIREDVPTGGEFFRPLESKAIEVFRKIASDVTEGRKVEIVE